MAQVAAQLIGAGGVNERERKSERGKQARAEGSDKHS